MAICKPIADSMGMTMTYHRIQRIEKLFSFDSVIIEVHLAQYASEVYREQEKESGQNLILSPRGDLVRFELPATEGEGLTRQQLYERIMALPDWQGSTEI